MGEPFDVFEVYTPEENPKTARVNVWLERRSDIPLFGEDQICLLLKFY